MGDEPKVELKCLNLRSSDPMKGVGPFRQQKEKMFGTAEQCCDISGAFQQHNAGAMQSSL